MKRILTGALLALVTIAGLTACSDKATTPDGTKNGSVTAKDIENKAPTGVDGSVAQGFTAEARGTLTYAFELSKGNPITQVVLQEALNGSSLLKRSPTATVTLKDKLATFAATFDTVTCSLSFSTKSATEPAQDVLCEKTK